MQRFNEKLAVISGGASGMGALTAKRTVEEGGTAITLDINDNLGQEVANEMSTGALKNSEANLGISITGIAGPEGGSLTKPVGTVYFSIANQEKVILEHKSVFDGSRETIRKESVLFVLNKLLNLTL